MFLLTYTVIRNQTMPNLSPLFFTVSPQPPLLIPRKILFWDWKKSYSLLEFMWGFSVCFLKDRKRWTIFDICIKLCVCVCVYNFCILKALWYIGKSKWMKFQDVRILISHLATLPTAENSFLHCLQKKKKHFFLQQEFLISTKMMNKT